MGALKVKIKAKFAPVEAKQIMPHLVSMVTGKKHMDGAMPMMPNLTKAIGAGDSAKQGRLKVDAGGMGAKKKIMKKAIKKAKKAKK